VHYQIFLHYIFTIQTTSEIISACSTMVNTCNSYPFFALVSYSGAQIYSDHCWSGFPCKWRYINVATFNLLTFNSTVQCSETVSWVTGRLDLESPLLQLPQPGCKVNWQSAG